MRPIFQKLTSSPEEGFAFKEIRGRGFDCPWHFHSECELILVQRSGGFRMLGDHLAALRPGDLVLVGSNLPHIYHNDEGAPGGSPPVRALLIQFEADCLGEGLMRLPALGHVRRLLGRAALGLEVRGATRDRVAAMMVEMGKIPGVPRIARFLEILDMLARSRESRTLASPGFAASGNPFDQDRMNRVCRFISERLERPIFLAEVARMVHLSEGAFSRFFRLHTGKTFPAFVNELRVGRACRLLSENEMNVTEVAFACGFENLSNFNRQFLRLKGSNPSEFRRAVAAAGVIASE
ncbi:MAG: helix-turn-helix domain-containing protein [Verrucomicrobiae bacterium]|nr:helix-turn-helix domain-containing protein [Verrucomicrobiae bacterium]